MKYFNEQNILQWAQNMFSLLLVFVKQLKKKQEWDPSNR